MTSTRSGKVDKSSPGGNVVLFAGWIRRESTRHPGRFYFFNEDTGESRWQLTSVIEAETKNQPTTSSSQTPSKSNQFQRTTTPSTYSDSKKTSVHIASPATETRKTPSNKTRNQILSNPPYKDDCAKKKRHAVTERTCSDDKKYLLSIASPVPAAAKRKISSNKTSNCAQKPAPYREDCAKIQCQATPRSLLSCRIQASSPSTYSCDKSYSSIVSQAAEKRKGPSNKTTNQASKYTPYKKDCAEKMRQATMDAYSDDKRYTLPILSSDPAAAKKKIISNKTGKPVPKHSLYGEDCAGKKNKCQSTPSSSSPRSRRIHALRPRASSYVKNLLAIVSQAAEKGKTSSNKTTNQDPKNASYKEACAEKTRKATTVNTYSDDRKYSLPIVSSAAEKRMIPNKTENHVPKDAQSREDGAEKKKLATAGERQRPQQLQNACKRNINDVTGKTSASPPAKKCFKRSSSPPEENRLKVQCSAELPLPATRGHYQAEKRQSVLKRQIAEAKKTKSRKKKNSLHAHPTDDQATSSSVKEQQVNSTAAMPTKQSSLTFFNDEEKVNASVPMDVEMEDIMADEVTGQLHQIRDKLNSTAAQEINTDELCQPKTADTPCTPSNKDGLHIVLDTNVLISHLAFLEELRDQSLKGLGRPVLVVPWVVLQELDGLKTGHTLSGKSKSKVAKQAIAAGHFIHTCIKSLHPRVQCQSIQCSHMSEGIPIECNDDRVLRCCLQYKKMGKDMLVVLFSNDVNLCTKAMVSGVSAFTKEDLLSGLKDLANSTISNKMQTNPKETIDIIKYDSRTNRVCKFQSTVKDVQLHQKVKLSSKPDNAVTAQESSDLGRKGEPPSGAAAQDKSDLDLLSGLKDLANSTISNKMQTNLKETIDIIKYDSRTNRACKFQSTVKDVQLHQKVKLSSKPDNAITAQESSDLGRKDEPPSAEAAQDKSDLADDILCEMKRTLTQCLSVALETEMKNAYDDLWLAIVHVKPPWTFKDLLGCFDKHWMAVFGLFMARVDKKYLNELQNYFKKNQGYGVTLTTVSQLVYNARQLCMKLYQHDKSNNILQESISTLDSLLNKCNKTLPKEPEGSCLSNENNKHNAPTDRKSSRSPKRNKCLSPSESTSVKHPPSTTCNSSTSPTEDPISVSTPADRRKQDIRNETRDCSGDVRSDIHDDGDVEMVCEDPCVPSADDVSTTSVLNVFQSVGETIFSRSASILSALQQSNQLSSPFSPSSDRQKVEWSLVILCSLLLTVVAAMARLLQGNDNKEDPYQGICNALDMFTREFEIHPEGSGLHPAMFQTFMSVQANKQILANGLRQFAEKLQELHEYISNLNSNLYAECRQTLIALSTHGFW